LVLSIIVFVVERVIGTIVAFAAGIAPTNPVLVTVIGFLVVLFAALIVNGLVAWFYNMVAKKFGGIEVSISKK
jgi:hypothetical protein